MSPRPKTSLCLGVVLLALMLAFTAANCFADTDMIWTYDSGGGEDYSALSTWEGDTDIVITSANNVVVVSHGGVTGSIGNGDTVTGATSSATGTVVGVVSDSQICIDVTSGDFQNSEQIYKTINVDYVTSSSAEDTLGIMYLDCYDGPHDDYVDLADATTDSNHYRCIRSASDCTTPFTGERETGAYFETTHSDDIFTLTENYCRVEHVGGKLTNTHPSQNRRVFDIWGNYCKVIGCVMYDGSSTGTGVVHGVRMVGDDGLVVNSIAHDNTGDGFRVSAYSGESNYVYNCTAVDNGEFGFDERNPGSNYVWNCVGDNNTSGDFAIGFNSSSDYNMSGDTSAPGTNNKTSKSFTNMWVTETSGSEDYHLSATGEADSDFQGGADPSGTLNPPDYTLVHDIDEQERETWYRGADEYNPRLYVWSGGSDDAPYISWATAAHSIQDAIDEASSGNIVRVRVGTYNENITMADGVNVENRPGDRPIIDGGGSVVVTFNGAFSTGCSLEGFEVEDGGSNGVIYLQGTGTGIDNNTVIQDCYVHGNTSGPGIKIDGSTATTAPTIEYSDIYSNSQEGIYIIDAGSSSEALVIEYNDIYSHTSKAGINIGGDSYITIGPENAIHNNLSGIAFDTGDPSSKPITIIDNRIYSNTNEGIIVKDAVTNTETITITENEIDDNVYGGIQILNRCELEITKNEIHENLRGGIHTGTQAADPGGFSGTAGSAVLTVRENKVWGNGQSSYGGGIDVRHADGTIYNNLVYRNRRGGIRFGDWIDEIINNTLAYNGNATDDMGGGIIYDDISEGDAVNAKPAGDPPAALEIKNNICAYDQKAGMRACFTNTLDSEERDYNLVYLNNGETDDCGWYRQSGGKSYALVMTCINKQFGGCGADWPFPFALDGPHDIIADPEFQDKDNDDYRLKSTSPAVDAGDTSYGTDVSIPPGVGTSVIDMGAYGGPYGIDW